MNFITIIMLLVAELGQLCEGKAGEWGLTDDFKLMAPPNKMCAGVQVYIRATGRTGRPRTAGARARARPCRLPPAWRHAARPARNMHGMD
jgi:hypothetical protein